MRLPKKAEEGVRNYRSGLPEFRSTIGIAFLIMSPILVDCCEKIRAELGTIGILDNSNSTTPPISAPPYQVWFLAENNRHGVD